MGILVTLRCVMLMTAAACLGEPSAIPTSAAGCLVKPGQNHALRTLLKPVSSTHGNGRSG